MQRKKDYKVPGFILKVVLLATVILNAAGQSYYHSKGFAYQDHVAASYTFIGNLSISKCSYQCLVNQCTLMKLQANGCYLAYLGEDTYLTWTNSKALQQLVQLIYMNLAYGKPTTSSMSLPGRDSHLAVDDDLNVNSGFASASNSSPWLMIDLQMPYNVNRMDLFAPKLTDIDDLTIFTSASNVKPTSSASMTSYIRTGHNVIRQSNIKSVHWTPTGSVPTLMRYVMLVKDEGYYLNVDELLVYGYA